MYVVNNMDQIHHQMNEFKKLTLFIFKNGGGGRFCF